MKSILKRSASFNAKQQYGLCTKFTKISMFPIKMNAPKPIDGLVKEKMIRFNDIVEIGEARSDYDRRALLDENVPLMNEEDRADAHQMMEMYMEDQKMTRLLMRFNQKCIN